MMQALNTMRDSASNRKGNGAVGWYMKVKALMKSGTMLTASTAAISPWIARRVMRGSETAALGGIELVLLPCAAVASCSAAAGFTMKGTLGSGAGGSSDP